MTWVEHTWFPASPLQLGYKALQWGYKGAERSGGDDREGAGSSAGQGSPSGVDRRSYFRGMWDHCQGKKGFLPDTMGYLHGMKEYPCGSRIRLQGRMGSLQHNQPRCQGRGREVAEDVLVSDVAGT